MSLYEGSPGAKLNSSLSISTHDVAGCQNYGPFLGPDFNTAPNI